MRDLVTPFAKALEKLTTEEAIEIPDDVLLPTYRAKRVGKSIREALARQLPASVSRSEIIFLRKPGSIVLINEANASRL